VKVEGEGVGNLKVGPVACAFPKQVSHDSTVLDLGLKTMLRDDFILLPQPTINDTFCHPSNLRGTIGVLSIVAASLLSRIAR
jgi:hypothetical protein